MRKNSLKNIPDFRNTIKRLYKKYKILTWIVGIFSIFSALVLLLAGLRTAFPPELKNIENSNLPQKTEAGYYTDWIYIGTESSRSLPTNDTLNKYEFRSVDTKFNGDTSYPIYTYGVYTRSYINP